MKQNIEVHFSESLKANSQKCHISGGKKWYFEMPSLFTQIRSDQIVQMIIGRVNKNKLAPTWLNDSFCLVKSWNVSIWYMTKQCDPTKRRLKIFRVFLSMITAQPNLNSKVQVEIYEPYLSFGTFGFEICDTVKIRALLAKK